MDAVSEVLNIKGSGIEDTATFGVRFDMEFILGMAKMNGGVKMLLDIDKVLGKGEIRLSEIKPKQKLDIGFADHQKLNFQEKRRG